MNLIDALQFRDFVTSASFGDASWNFGVGQEIPVGESKVTFSAGALGDVEYTVTKQETPRFGEKLIDDKTKLKLPKIMNTKKLPGDFFKKNKLSCL